MAASLVAAFVADDDEQAAMPQRDAPLHQGPDAAVDLLPHAC